MTIPGPLRPWFWCGLWVALIWPGLVALDQQGWLGARYYPLHADLDRNLQQLSEFGERTDGQLKILALGDSLLGASLPDPAAFSTLLGDDILWLHFSLRAASRVDFAPFMTAIRSIRPDLIIVQDSVLKPVEPPPTRLRRAFHSVRNLPGKLARFWSGADADSINVPGRRAYNQRVFAESVPTDPESLEFVAELHSVSDSLIVINLPRSVAVHGGESKAVWLRYLGQELGGINVPVLVVGEPLPSDHYVNDQAHTNEKGRQVRTGLIKQLVEERIP